MPIRYPRVLIVDAPTSTAKVLYDFQDDTQPLETGSKTALHAQDWNFGNLDLLGDPDAVGVDWGLRQVSFTQEIAGSKSAALARQALMSKALLRRRFWLKFQLTASTTAVYWYAYRTPPGALSLEQVYADGSLTDRWEIAGTIDADPFSFAARVTQPTKTIGNNPANDGTAPSSGYNLPAIKGDAPARLRMLVTASAGNGSVGSWLVATVASDRPAPITRIAVGTGDSIASSNIPTASNTGAIGGSVRATSRDAAGAALYMQFYVPGMTPLLRGRYLVIARVSATSGAVIRYQLNNTYTNTAAAPAVSVSHNDSNFRYVPLGVVGVGGGIPDDIAATVGPQARIVTLTAVAANTAHTVVFDDFILIPVDGPGIVTTTVLQLAMNFTPNTGFQLNIDGDAEVAWISFQNEGLVSMTASGGFPQVDPAAAYNTLLVLPTRDDGTASTGGTALNGTATVQVSYQPRASWIGDGAT